VRFPVEARVFFSLLHSVQTGSGAQIVSYIMTVSQEVQRPGRKADHSPPFSTELKNGGVIPPLPLTSSRHDAFSAQEHTG
jgi:hypothetical protein